MRGSTKAIAMSSALAAGETFWTRSSPATLAATSGAASFARMPPMRSPHSLIGWKRRDISTPSDCTPTVFCASRSDIADAPRGAAFDDKGKMVLRGFRVSGGVLRQGSAGHRQDRRDTAQQHI
jgi:hypothetical protein